MDLISQQTKPIHTLTSLRFFAAFMVLLYHLPFNFLNEQHSFIKNVLIRIFHEGFAGVTFFFILSGFILTYKYLPLIQDRKINLKTFIFLRFAKLYPTHLLTFLLSLPIIAFTQEHTLHSKFLYGVYFLGSGTLNLLLLHSMFPFSYLYWSFNSVSWSISTEFFLYFFGFFLLAAQQKTLFKFLMLEIFLLCILFYINHNFEFLKNFSTWLFYINPITRILDFIIGIFLARLYFRFSTNNSKSNILNASTLLFTAIEIGSLFFSGLFVYIAIVFHVSELLRWDLFYIIPFSFLIFIFSLQQGLVSKILQTRSLVFLGNASFAIYMFHQIIIHYLLSVNHYLNNFYILKNIELWFALCTLTFTVAISSLISLGYERKMNFFLRNKFFTQQSKSNYFLQLNPEQINQGC